MKQITKQPWFWLVMAVALTVITILNSQHIWDMNAVQWLADLMSLGIFLLYIFITYRFFTSFFVENTRRRWVVSIVLLTLLAWLGVGILSTFAHPWDRSVAGFPFGRLQGYGLITDTTSVIYPLDTLNIYLTQEELLNHFFWWVVFGLGIIIWAIKQRKHLISGTRWQVGEKVVAVVLYFLPALYISDGLARGLEGGANNYFSNFGPSPFLLKYTTNPNNISDQVFHDSNWTTTILLNEVIWVAIFTAALLITLALWSRKKRNI